MDQNMDLISQEESESQTQTLNQIDISQEFSQPS